LSNDHTQELEFLADNGTITHAQLSSMLDQLPAETQGIRSDPTPAPSAQPTPAIAPVAAVSSMNLNNGYDFHRSNSHSDTPSYNEKQQQEFYKPPSGPPPPAYPATPQPPPAALTHATALYPYAGSDNGDLGLQRNDRVAVTEYMNADWWKGRNERTGQEGIFPRNYVKVEDVKTPGGPSNYGNMPLDVAQGSGGQQQGQEGPNKGAEMGKKFGKKLGNAAIFGAGATMGSNLVNSIF
jgi:hypothetical protein